MDLVVLFLLIGLALLLQVLFWGSFLSLALRGRGLSSEPTGLPYTPTVGPRFGPDERAASTRVSDPGPSR